MILTRSELEVVLTDVPDPLGLLVETNIPLPWHERDGLPKLLSVTFAGRYRGELRGWKVPLSEAHPSVRGEVWEVLRQRTFYTWSAPVTTTVVRRLCGDISPAIIGDALLAATMLREPLGARPPFTEEGAVEVWRAAEVLTSMLKGQRAAYELEKQVASFLMEMSVAGYQWADERVHPIWATVHESGSGRIVSRQPSLSNVRKADRVNFKADPYKRWVCVAWPYADLTMVALLSGDPALKAVISTTDPYEVLASLWSCDRAKAETVWKNIATHGPNTPRVSEALKEDATTYVEKFVAAAPRWHDWLLAKTAEVPMVEAWLGRRIHVSEGRKVHGAVVMESVSTALKMMLAFLRHESEFRAGAEMAGFSSVIPLYDRVFYQLDVHVPVDRHVELAHRVGALSQVGGNFAVEVSMGPSWGELYRVDGSVREFGQVLADLTTPPPIPIRCPACKQTAQDWPTLEDHLRDAHKWADEEIGGAR
jgi:hypothetical protein